MLPLPPSLSVEQRAQIASFCTRCRYGPVPTARLSTARLRASPAASLPPPGAPSPAPAAVR
eukprot:750634-Rhodomonas_salina.1